MQEIAQKCFLKKKIDSGLQTVRNRCQRIAFEWLTEEIPLIESISFTKEVAEESILKKDGSLSELRSSHVYRENT